METGPIDNANGPHPPLQLNIDRCITISIFAHHFMIMVVVTVATTILFLVMIMLMLWL